MVVDILMCTYNGEAYIEQQIQSILDQTHTDFRLIIVDDISKDRTVEIIQKMMLLDKRIELHQNPKNLGYFNNFLSGLDYVTSDFLFFADQDDIWVENKLEVQLSDLMQEDENVLMNFSNSFLLY
ncbi:MAG: glycosyltransferase, partial [Fluviicola sp.]